MVLKEEGGRGRLQKERLELGIRDVSCLPQAEVDFSNMSDGLLVQFCPPTVVD